MTRSVNMSIELHFGGISFSFQRRVPRLACLLIAVSVFLPMRAQPRPTELPQSTVSSDQDPENVANKQPAPGEVMIEGHPVLKVYQPIGSYSPKDRAALIAQRILDAARDLSISPESVVSTPRGAWVEITAGGKILMAVTDEDAKLAGKPRAQLAMDDAENIRQYLMDYKRDHSWRSMIWGILDTLLATALFLLAMMILRRAEFAERRHLGHWMETHFDNGQEKSAWRILLTYAVSLAIALGSAIRWILVVAVFEIYLVFVLGRFPPTRSVSHAITEYILSGLTELGRSGLEYLPNLFIVVAVAVIASQVSRLIRFVFREIGSGSVVVSGFYPEWAEPTAKLIRALVLVLAVVIAFPYLPGSKSPAFQGISIFVGLLLSLGSSSVVANIISGIILTYMRSFGVGDWVRIGDTVGEVVEKNLLVTRIVTPKQEITTIPNATVMAGQVMNYTREAKNAGVIFHTTVTIGYDAPWRTVHQLLIDAALATKHVLRKPEPFVLQTGLNDFYVSYELNAYTDIPTQMQFIYSQLHENIQDNFNKAGVEICSPHFASLRDGNTITIPEQFRPPSYSVPAFRVEDSKSEEPHPAGRVR
jgi:small-conductance mechanosensitive channel